MAGSRFKLAVLSLSKIRLPSGSFADTQGSASFQNLNVNKKSRMSSYVKDYREPAQHLCCLGLFLNYGSRLTIIPRGRNRGARMMSFVYGDLNLSCQLETGLSFFSLKSDA